MNPVDDAKYVLEWVIAWSDWFNPFVWQHALLEHFSEEGDR